MHAVNNLLQRRAFTVSDFNTICYQLTPDAMINPHKNMFGLGFFDVNVLIMALQAHDLDVVWHDLRIPVESLNVTAYFGFLLNLKANRWFFPGHSHHWVAVRRVGDCFFNMDSKLQEPEPLHTEAVLKAFLALKVKEGALLFLVKHAGSS